MSLLNLIHRNIVIKFSETAREQMLPGATHVFRLDGVDAMGFLLVQPMKENAEGGLPVGEAYWINKDLVSEIHDFSAQRTRELAAARPEPPKSAPAPKASKPRLPKAKSGAL